MGDARSRSGFALAATLGVLSVLGLMMAGAFAASLRARHSARLAGGEITLSAAADHVVYGALEPSGGTPLADLPLGAATIHDGADPELPDDSARVAVTRLPGNLLWIVADVLPRASNAIERRVALIAHFPVAGAPPNAAIVARGAVALGDAVRLLLDTAHDADCAAPDAPDVVLAPGASLSSSAGIRAETQAAASDSATYLLTARQVALLRNKPGVLVVDGDTTIASGNLEGILIVLGTLTVGGPLSVTGLVVARGGVHGTAPGLSVTGALLAFDAPGSASDSARGAVSLGDATIRYSPCVVARALRRAAPPVPLRHRGWSELF